ncbi:MAG TPA: phosphomannomutase/phosphoglucomutase [Candidatus Poseidoniales archaeon]|jgi:phosphomannomutase/phosphoglucomutase|nr:MAG: phosphomannomutase [Euryarchaeota archaeon]HIG34504.1 phosphomannomutase/phosphoglucomutase [Candidatus Poseidoniales archaeon]HIL68003.1 phosphomannomutase/phosphoglucomutase [Candidatus Poseidoniales archaeon]
MSVFKAYDIRGIAGDELDVEFSERLGRAIATHLDAKSVSLVRDIRESSPSYHEAFVKGLRSAGADVIDLGISTTGVLYRSTVDLPVDVAVAITASHNPPEYNGFKICQGKMPVGGENLQDIRRTFEAGEFRRGDGAYLSMDDYEDSYIGAIEESVGKPSREVRVVLDCGNAVPGPLAFRTLEKLGVDVIPIYCDWDNSFPNHPPDPTRQENMIDLGKAVVEHGAEFGIGMDGDGDRLGVVDENGNFIHPDRLMGIFVKDVLENIEEGASEEERTIFFDVKCSMALEESILRLGGVPKMVRTGHTFMKLELKENPGSPMAGEMSGHFFMNDCWDGFDDSIYNAARLLEIVSRDKSPDYGGVKFSERFEFMPEYPSTDEGKVPLVGDREDVMAAVKNAYADMEFSEVDGVRVRYDRGWFLCRPSNTEPILVMRAEAKDRTSLEEILTDIEARIGHVADIGKLK